MEFIFSENVIPVHLPPPARHPVLWYVWFELSVKMFIKKTQIDLFISPDGFIPIHSNCKTVSVIHDLNFEHRVQDVPLLTRSYYKRFFPKFASHSDRIIAVSKYSKKDIIHTYNIDTSKIDVVYNGVSDTFRPLTIDIQKRIQNNYAKGEPFFLYVGAIHPRKNIANMLLAFDKFCQQSNKNFMLLLVGKKMFDNSDLDSLHSSMLYKDNVVFTGWLTDEVLKDMMASAHALLFIPYFEGFGIPVIEAMKSGVPVICSNVTSLPEVAGDAALMVSPESLKDISNAMLKITRDNELRNRLISKGLQKSNEYTWEKTAEGVWNSINKCLSNGT
jgi:glycosyltransferase involved in cell wall biosynthesis